MVLVSVGCMDCDLIRRDWSPTFCSFASRRRSALQKAAQHKASHCPIYYSEQGSQVLEAGVGNTRLTDRLTGQQG